MECTNCGEKTDDKNSEEGQIACSKFCFEALAWTGKAHAISSVLTQEQIREYRKNNSWD